MIKLRRDLLAVAQTRFRTGIDTADGVAEASAEMEVAVKRDAGVTAQLRLSAEFDGAADGPGTGRRTRTCRRESDEPAGAARLAATSSR